jgi:hypothetical protein
MENIAADISGKGKDNLGRACRNPSNPAPMTGKTSAVLHSVASAGFRAVDFPQ